MEEEHPIVLEGIPRDAELSVEPRADALAPAPTHRQSIIGATLGFIALTIGVVCIGLILWAVSFC
jgi:hypothetical protein